MANDGEILESAVVDSTRSVGCEAKSNVYLEAKSGEEREVDIWGYYNVPEIGAELRIYVSCKNRIKPLGISFSDREHGRVESLLQVPHIKFLVAPDLTKPARNAARAYGFIPIEIDEKVTMANIHEKYCFLRNTFSNTLNNPSSRGSPVEFTIPWVCSRCGHDIHPDARSCGDCGIVVDGPDRPVHNDVFARPWQSGQG